MVSIQRDKERQISKEQRSTNDLRSWLIESEQRSSLKGADRNDNRLRFQLKWQEK